MKFDLKKTDIQVSCRKAYLENLEIASDHNREGETRNPGQDLT